MGISFSCKAFFLLVINIKKSQKNINYNDIVITFKDFHIKIPKSVYLNYNSLVNFVKINF
ncbi:hypothetical protein DOS84_03575 [Flavobacterium aquariorum]|uniref:Uncharacterized protein n=1 Tax=Flavobacterium aquariorum TaxID=2217670 RepID=A0A2W7UHH9_9FLAO|nr:hypothetical protein DOS84_03575 [Flavobacterium aquariorum]